MVTVLTTESSLPRGVKSLIEASYMIVAFPPAGTDIPVMARGGPAVTAGAVESVPFV